MGSLADVRCSSTFPFHTSPERLYSRVQGTSPRIGQTALALHDRTFTTVPVDVFLAGAPMRCIYSSRAGNPKQKACVLRVEE